MHMNTMVALVNILYLFYFILSVTVYSSLVDMIRYELCEFSKFILLNKKIAIN